MRINLSLQLLWIKAPKQSSSVPQKSPGGWAPACYWARGILSASSYFFPQARRSWSLTAKSSLAFHFYQAFCRLFGVNLRGWVFEASAHLSQKALSTSHCARSRDPVNFCLKASCFKIHSRSLKLGELASLHYNFLITTPELRLKSVKCDF